MAEATAFQHDGTTRLVLSGEVDLADYESLSAHIRRLEERRPRVLTLDLRQVDYMDSTGVRWLLEAHERARQAGRRLLVIHSAGQALIRLFALCKLDELLDLVEDPAPVAGWPAPPRGPGPEPSLRPGG